MKPEISKDMIRGHTDTIVLNILDQGDSYGYAIAKTIRQLSHGMYEINEATLYTIFRRLEKSGDIASYWGDETQGGRRRYYQITSQGRQILTKRTTEWQFAKKVIDELISGRVKQNDR